MTIDRRKLIDNAAATVDKSMLSGRKGLQAALSGLAGDSKSVRDLTFSRSTLYRRQKKQRAKIAENVKTNLNDKIMKGDKFIIHWDEKMLNGRRHVDKSSEHMAIVVTNVMTGELFLPINCNISAINTESI